MQQHSDWQLIEQMRDGSEAACNTIMQRYERLLFYISRRYGLGQEDSADIVQQTFLAMIERLHTFHADSNLKGWLSVVCKRRCWERLQQYDHEQVHDEPLTDSLLLMGRATTNPDRFATVEWLVDGLNAIGERCHALLQLLYFSPDEPSYDDVAAQLGMKVGSIGPTRGRCLRKLKDVLQTE